MSPSTVYSIRLQALTNRHHAWEKSVVFLAPTVLHYFPWKKKKRWLNETNFWAVHWTHLQVKLLSLWSKAGCSCSRAGLQPPPTCRFIRMQSLLNPVVSKWSRLAYYLKVWRAFFNPDHFDWFGLEKDCMRSYVCRHQPHSSGTQPSHFEPGWGSKPLNLAQLKAKQHIWPQL